MRLDKAVVLDRSQLKEAIDSLQGCGIIELLISKQETVPDQKPIFIRSGGIFQQLRAWLSGESARKTKADQICNQLQLTFRNLPGHDSLLQNVRKQIMKQGHLTGDFLAINLKSMQEGRVAVAKADVPFLLPEQGQQVRILSGRPTEFESERCIVGYDTAEEVLGANMKNSSFREQEKLSSLQVWSVGSHANGGPMIHEFSAKLSLAKTIASCPPLDKSSTEVRTPREMSELIRNAIGDATGRIVIEPQPDRVVLGMPAFSNAGLKAQILAAMRAKSNAQNSGHNRVIAFVSPDLALLERIESLHAQIMDEWRGPRPPDVRRIVIDSAQKSDSDSRVGSDDSDDDGTGVFLRG